MYSIDINIIFLKKITFPLNNTLLTTTVFGNYGTCGCLEWTLYCTMFFIIQIQDSLIYNVVRQKPDLRVINYYGEEFIHN